MKTELIQAVRLNTENLFQNASICLQTCDMDFILCGMPIWKHAYHMLHSCDQWFINPNEMLYEIPNGCTHNRLAMILSQFRHFYAHLGNINATTILATNRWPRVVNLSGKSGKSAEGLFE